MKQINTNNTVSALSANIGKRAVWSAQNGLFFEVVIKDVEVFYGNPHYMVAPVAGTGLARVRDHLKILDTDENADHPTKAI